MEGCYEERTWFVFDLHSRNTVLSASETFVKKAAYETKLVTRAVSDPPKKVKETKDTR